MIADTLFPMLRERFPGCGLRIETEPNVCAIFPAIHPNFGDLQVHEDGDEVTIYAGNFTHGHFGNYEAISDEQKATVISEDVIDFLDAVFADKVAFWGSHKGLGGWRRLRLDSQKEHNTSEYVWSGPRSNRSR